MTESTNAEPQPQAAPIVLGERAVAALTTEFVRHAGPKSALLIGVRPASPVLLVALDALESDDRLTVVPADGHIDTLRAEIAGHGGWIAQRVKVIASLAEADPADVVIVAEPLTGTADAARAFVDAATKHLTEGGVLAVTTVAAPWLADGAGAEIGRQSSFYGVGSDVVVRNRPPVRVHRLRFGTAPIDLAARLAPAVRPSSIPLTAGMHIDANGVAAAGVALAIALAARASRPASKLWLLPALLAAPVAAFFRDPEREIPEEDAIVAACDGRVLSVERLTDTRLGDEEFLRIAVFLSILDVHINRTPVAGRVADYFVEDGGYAPAMRPEAEHNVAAYTVLDTEHGTVVVAQRTGLIARRIVHRAPVGSVLAKGERFGLIRFGSRTDVYVPATAADAVVAPGDKVAGGETVIARWR